MPKRAAKASGPAPNEDPTPAESVDDAVRRRAYELYLQGGGADGRDLENWLEAEREIKARPRPRIPAARARRKT